MGSPTGEKAREANEVESLLDFSPDTAGGMMNTEIVVVGEAAQKEICAPAENDTEVRTWFLRLGVEPRPRKMSRV